MPVNKPPKPPKKPPKPAAKRIHSITGNDAALIRSEALNRIGITQQQLAVAPAITPLLKLADGGLDQVYTAMRFAPDGLITAFLVKYDSIPDTDRVHLSIEAVALAANINIARLLDSIQLALQQYTVHAVKIIAASSHSKITQARVTYGQLPLGEKDRTALDTAMGFLPMPRPPTFIGQAIFGSGQSTMDQQRRIFASDDDDAGDPGDPADYDLDKLFPAPRLMQEKLNAIRNRQLPPVTEPNDAENAVIPDGKPKPNGHE